MPEKGLATTFSQIRQLDDGEHERVTEAEELFDHFGPTWPHTTAVRIAGAFAQALERLEAGRALVGGAVNESDLSRALGALHSFAEHVTNWIADATSARGPVADTASVAAGSVPVMLCKRIAGGEIPNLLMGEPHQITVDFEGGASVGAAWLVTASLSVCRSVADTELVEAEPSLLAAGALIMGLRAEVVWGEPTLLSTREVHPSEMNLTPQPIQWQRVEPILTACAVARAAVSPRSGGTAPAEASMDAPPATGARMPESPPASGDGESYASGEDGPPNDASSSGPRYAPVDMAAFVHEATSLAQTTERRWSKALGETIDNDIKDVAARARSLLMSLGRLVVQEGEGEPVLPQIPLTPVTANGLSLTPDDEQQDVQHGIAVIQVMLELAQALEALSQPTGWQIDLLQGKATSWWTQHGFNHVQYRGELATRVVADRAFGRPIFRRQMTVLAQSAWTAGLPEAAIIYLAGALDPVTEAAGPLATAFATLKMAARQLGAGDQVSLDAVVLLARFWLDELARRITEGPASGVAEAELT
jgi:hypothetical protein